MSTGTENPSAEFKLSFDDSDVIINLEFHFSDNAEEFIDVPAFVSFAANAVLEKLGS